MIEEKIILKYIEERTNKTLDILNVLKYFKINFVQDYKKETFTMYHNLGYVNDLSIDDVVKITEDLNKQCDIAIMNYIRQGVVKTIEGTNGN